MWRLRWLGEGILVQIPQGEQVYRLGRHSLAHGFSIAFAGRSARSRLFLDAGCLWEGFGFREPGGLRELGLVTATFTDIVDEMDPCLPLRAASKRACERVLGRVGGWLVAISSSELLHRFA